MGEIELDSDDIYIVELTTLVYGGDAMGRLPDGRAVFVPFALPGEKVRVHLVEQKRNFARAELLEVIEPSPQRIEPRCLHFGICGGCDYQHMTYEDQLTVKTNILRDQLQRIAGIENPPIQPIVPSPSPWYYRNTIQFHLTPDGKLGYVEAGIPRVFGISECHLPEAALNDTWPRLELEPVPGLERIELRADAAGEVLMVLESSTPETPEFEVDLPLSAVHLSPQGPVVLAGDDHVIFEVLGRPFYVSAPSFFQVNTPMAAAMVQHLLDNLPLTSHTLVMDLYAGVGLFSAFLAGRVERVIAVEASAYAVQDFATNLQEFDNVEIYEGTAEHILPSLDARPDVVVVDPPRAGLERTALDALVQMAPATLAYVSCDQATLARDAKRLIQAGYQLEQITPFDLFPQTYHIESISLFRRVQGDQPAPRAQHKPKPKFKPKG